MLRENDEITLYTDGVLEARRPDGEIFGFERVETMLAGKPSASTIAETAREFFQEDDITVVKVVRLYGGAGHETCTLDHAAPSAQAA